MERTITATKARIHFGEVLRRVAEQGERIIVERSGKPQVVILSVATYRRLQAAQPQEDWRELVRQAREQVRSELGERELPPPEEMIRQMREERTAQIVTAVAQPKRLPADTEQH